MEGGKFDLMEFLGRHNKDVSFPKVESVAKSLKTDHGFQKLGAIGFCWGGWAVFQLGAKGTTIP